MAIVPDSKRYQVFVSSTYRDLIAEREEVMKALLELDCIPAGMELFPAANEDQWSLIKRIIDDCDYYLVIVGGRYGSVDAKGISYTEREYDYAVEQGIPVLGFVHGDPDKIPAGQSELDEEAREHLTAFRKKVMSRMVKFWLTPPELGGLVSRSLVQTMKNQPRIGWVKASGAIPPETLVELAELRARIAELEGDLGRQADHPPEGAEDLMQGDDTFIMHWSGQKRREKDKGVFDFGGDPLQGTWECSWNKLFAILGPLMLDEASENRLVKQLHDYAYSQIRLVPDYTTLLSYGLTINTDDFQTIKMQLFALGLIARSERKHTASDRNTYWSLTPFGERKLMTLRAIKRLV